MHLIKRVNTACCSGRSDFIENTWNGEKTCAIREIGIKKTEHT